MDCLTPPPTPPHRDQLALSSLTSSPPTSSIDSNSATNNDHNSLAQINTLLLRSRCDSEKTLLNEVNTEGEEEEEEEGQVESANRIQEEELVQVRVTLEVQIGHESTPREVVEKIESELREVLKGLCENKEGEQGETRGSEFQKIQEELRLLKRQLKRAQQSIQDLRLNNQSLRLQASEAIKISHQAEQDLDKVLEAFKSNRTRGARGGSSWVVVFALFVWVVLSKCS